MKWFKAEVEPWVQDRDAAKWRHHQDETKKQEE
jgi:hypothetical protein